MGGDQGRTVLTGANRRASEHADAISYEFTVDDPTTWTRPWTAAFPMMKTQGQLYEYACHEGNYGLKDVLAGARAQEKAAEQAETRKQ